MNSNKVIGIVVVVIILIGLAFYFASDNAEQGNESMMENEDALIMEEGDDMTDNESMMEDESTTRQGSYEAYSEEKLALANDGDVVLFFRASWCPTCRTLDADIRANAAAIPDGVTILDVDYDNSTALKQKYGVTYQHTLVQVDAEGNQIAKWQGSPTLNSLISEIQ